MANELVDFSETVRRRVIDVLEGQNGGTPIQVVETGSPDRIKTVQVFPEDGGLARALEADVVPAIVVELVTDFVGAGAIEQGETMEDPDGDFEHHRASIAVTCISADSHTRGQMLRQIKPRIVGDPDLRTSRLAPRFLRTEFGRAQRDAGSTVYLAAQAFFEITFHASSLTPEASL